MTDRLWNIASFRLMPPPPLHPDFLRTQVLFPPPWTLQALKADSRGRDRALEGVDTNLITEADWLHTGLRVDCDGDRFVAWHRWKRKYFIQSSSADRRRISSPLNQEEPSTVNFPFSFYPLDSLHTTLKPPCPMRVRLRESLLHSLEKTCHFCWLAALRHAAVQNLSPSPFHIQIR